MKLFRLSVILCFFSCSLITKDIGAHCNKVPSRHIPAPVSSVTQTTTQPNANLTTAQPNPFQHIVNQFQAQLTAQQQELQTQLTAHQQEFQAQLNTITQNLMVVDISGIIVPNQNN